MNFWSHLEIPPCPSLSCEEIDAVLCPIKNFGYHLNPDTECVILIPWQYHSQSFHSCFVCFMDVLMPVSPASRWLGKNMGSLGINDDLAHARCNDLEAKSYHS